MSHCACVPNNGTYLPASLSLRVLLDTNLISKSFLTSAREYILELLLVTNDRICVINEHWRHRMQCSLECNSCSSWTICSLWWFLGACKLSLRRWQHQPNISDTLSLWTWTFKMVVKHVVCFSFLSIFIISQHLFPINYTQSCISNTLAAAATPKSRMPLRTIHLWTHTVFI